ncbi:hypothetical protein AFAEC_1697 [Aliarcobacter faecis]|uniref:hypothetical protein n=1 Tax=Aliarcobacter faecis TaxID=1564138 RepID=UPI000478B64F|nr:hypothetical protein [Aliarcobacter faecis]QKF73853.1 hypothetical protein AFAEC_1697 [Aliarcobacter faecis]
MKKNRWFLVGTLLSLSLFGNLYANNEMPFKLTYERQIEKYSSFYRMVSLVDNLVVNNILINKGKCITDLAFSDKMTKSKSFPFKLSEYDVKNFQPAYAVGIVCESVMRIDIETNFGTYSFDVEH